MRGLIAYLVDRLPLPTFEVWSADEATHPLEHLVARVAAGVATGTPAIVTRSLVVGTGRWTVSLHLLPGDPHWYGYVSFRAVSGPEAPAFYRTANVFAEPDPYRIQDSFRAFDAATLEAFLRSVRP